MYTKQELTLQHCCEGKGQRQIFRELGISRLTVKKYLSQYQLQRSDNEDPGNRLSKSLSEVPVYHTSNRGKLRLTREAQSAIDELLKPMKKSGVADYTSKL